MSAGPGTAREVDLDVVVAVHDLRRPVHRAVASALRSTDPRGLLPSGHRVRVTVACHELDPAQVRSTVERRLDQRGEGQRAPHVRYLEVRDGLGSPSGPFNAGIAAAQGRYVAIIGSDDWFADGALGAWATRADDWGSDWLMARLETQDGQHVPTPRARVGRTTRLDFVRDRLAYRTAPLGLLRTSTLRRLGLVGDAGDGPLTPGMKTGGDILLSLRLATGGLRLDYGVALPAYVIGTDGGDRITESRRPVTEELRAHRHLLDQGWIRGLDEASRRALAVKVLRIHVLGAVRRRPSTQDWSSGDVAALQRTVRALTGLAPGVTRALHRADQLLVRDLLASYDVADLAAASTRRARAGRLDILLTADPLANLDRESTVRAHVGVALTRMLAGISEGHVPRRPARPVDGSLAGVRVLVLAFSGLTGDARVLKQVRHLVAEGAQVVTCGYGPAPPGVHRHIEVPAQVRNDLDGRLISLRSYRAAYWAQRANRWVRDAVPPGTADVVIANDTDTLPLALSLRPAAGVHADLHEYWPRWREEHASWRARIGPYQAWLCRRYLPRAAAVTTVSRRIADEYADRFEVPVEVITNASPYADLSPTPVADPLRLVHTGAALRSRAIDVMVDGVLLAVGQGARVRLDLYLTRNDPAYLAELHELAACSSGAVRVHDPVPYADLFTTLNAHDVGIFVLPPVNFNYANALPNKIFDFVQGRLGVVVGPSPDMADLVRRHGLGMVADGFDAASVARTVAAVADADVRAWKQASDAVAHELSDERQSLSWGATVRSLLERTTR